MISSTFWYVDTALRNSSIFISFSSFTARRSATAFRSAEHSSSNHTNTANYQTLIGHRIADKTRQFATPSTPQTHSVAHRFVFVSACLDYFHSLTSRRREYIARMYKAHFPANPLNLQIMWSVVECGRGGEVPVLHDRWPLVLREEFLWLLFSWYLRSLISASLAAKLSLRFITSF